MTEPLNAAEFNLLFRRNLDFDFSGREVRTRFPCIFCAAPNWMLVTTSELQQALLDGVFCAECKRGVKCRIEKTDNGFSKKATLYQTSGPNQPDWFDPKIPKWNINDDTREELCSADSE